MIAHILSTGDEVLLGDIIDTNSGFLCVALKEMGITVQKIIAVGDDVNTIASSIGEVSRHADICLVTGGLGPTRDDVTALACSKAADETLHLDDDALKSMNLFFKKKGFYLTPENEKQAMLPVSAKMLTNHNGTAPGFYIKINQCMFFFMPGVPSEMKLMFEKEVKTVLANTFSLNEDILIQRLTVFGLPESQVGAVLKGFEIEYPDMRLGYRANFPVIEVKIVAAVSFSDKKKAESDLARAKEWAVTKLGNRVVSEKGLTIAQEVGSLLLLQHRTLAIAESCTGGLIADMVTDVPGSSDYFLFSGITYSNHAKIHLLNVQENTIKDHGAVAEQTALEMALGARTISNADYAISTTGIAGPGGGTDDKPVGMVCIGLAGPQVSMAKTYQFNFGDRRRNKKIFAMMALELLRRQLAAVIKTP